MSEKVGNKKNLLDRLGGDKVIWIIAICLSLISIVSIFSSTSLLASMNDSSRLDIARAQLFTIIGGLFLIFLCSRPKNPKFYQFLSQFGFVFSFIILLLLLTAGKLHIPFIKPVERNNATRWLNIFGLTISVYEMVKVAMVMYVAWAIDFLNKKKPFFKGNEFLNNIIFLFLPTMIITLMVFSDGGSSAMFIAAMLFLTMILGGVNFKHILILGGVAVILIGACFGLYQITKNSAHPVFDRAETMISRLTKTTKYYEQEVLNSTSKDKDYYEALDKIRQPYGAKIAVKEGGFRGKGPGQSTQKYKVAVMYEDYMFSFIVEEYGFLGALILIILYLSLLPRGSIIARNSDSDFVAVTVAGLTALICCQAIFHIVINCDVGILTGQTLPMVSHGRSSFLCFCVAFGVILSLSRTTVRKVEKGAEEGTTLTLENDNTEQEETI